VSSQWYSAQPDALDAVVEYVKARARVDPDRVYFSGLCIGASGVMEYAQVHPQQLAAILPIITQSPTPWRPERLRGLPTWLFHAFGDPAVSRQQTITWADAIAATSSPSAASCMDTYPYGPDQTANARSQSGAFRPGSGWTWRDFTGAADDALLQFTLLSVNTHEIWQFVITHPAVLHWLFKQRRQAPYAGVPAAVPGPVQAEAFDTGGERIAYLDATPANSGGSAFRRSINPIDGLPDDEQVDLVEDAEGVAVGDTAAGEWLAYTVDCAESGSYALALRVRAAAPGGALHLEGTGGALTSSIPIPITSGFTTLLVAGPTLPRGRQVLRLVVDHGGFDLDWFAITAPPGPADLVIDNRQTDKVASSGPWSVSDYVPGHYGPDYLSAAPDTSADATFRPNLPRAGWYEVFLWYPANQSRGIATVTVDHGGAAFVARVDERSAGSTWASLGTFDFAAGTGGAVTISSAGAGGYVSADAVRFAERPSVPPMDLIVDNPDHARVTTTGPWVLTSFTPGFYGADYLSAAPGSDCTATFRPNLPRSGIFAVSLRYPANASRGTAPVTVIHDGGTYATAVDQRRDGGTWKELGSFAFAAGPGAAVTIGSLGAGGYVGADAVRFAEVPALLPIDLVIDDDDAARVAASEGWSLSTVAPGFHGAGYLSTAPAPGRRVVYRPNLPRAGTFAISIWYPATPSRGTSPVTIAYGDGSLSEVIAVDQRSGGGQWNPLGVFPLDAGPAPTITIGTADTGGWIGADAVRLTEATIGDGG
jgi:hypothetical protein